MSWLIFCLELGFTQTITYTPKNKSKVCGLLCGHSRYLQGVRWPHNLSMYYSLSQLQDVSHNLLFYYIVLYNPIFVARHCCNRAIKVDNRAQGSILRHIKEDIMDIGILEQYTIDLFFGHYKSKTDRLRNL